MSYNDYIVSKSLSELGEIAKGMPSAARQAMGLRGESAVNWARKNPTLARRLAANQLPKRFGNTPEVREAGRAIKVSNMSPDEIRSYLRGPVRKGLPSIVRAGGGGFQGEALRSMNAIGRRNAQAIGQARRAGGNVGGLQYQAKNSLAGNPRDVMRRNVARGEGKLSFSVSNSPRPQAQDAYMRISRSSMGTNQKKAMETISARRQQLQNRLRPVRIQQGTANRPAW